MLRLKHDVCVFVWVCNRKAIVGFVKSGLFLGIYYYLTYANVMQVTERGIVTVCQRFSLKKLLETL